ncbi:MAG: DsrE family protein [Planctomycetes bacterium]|nr:DsrE family protein [Planctomycetota bacterium]MCB9887158.1 DsrE family protein [Planctomycetota bacterium]
MDTVVVCNQDQMGHGDRGLGQRILQTFLQKSIALPDFTAIVFFNSGVQLVAAGSPVLAELRALEERGVDLVPCGTCLNHFGVTPAVGKVADMDSIVRELGRAAKVITL